MTAAQDANFQKIVERIASDACKVLDAYKDQGVPQQVLLVAAFGIVAAYGNFLSIDRTAMHNALDSALGDLAATSLQTTEGETGT